MMKTEMTFPKCFSKKKEREFKKKAACIQKKRALLPKNGMKNQPFYIIKCLK